MLGHEVVRGLSERHEVHATVRDVDAARGHGVGGELHAFDASRPEALGELLGAVRPAAVVNCIGLVKQLEEASRPASAVALNALFPHQAAAASAEHGARFLHVSTDCVFAGELAPPGRYTEDDTPDARDLYGLSKLLGEVRAPGGAHHPHVDHRLGARARVGAARVARLPGRQAGEGLRGGLVLRPDHACARRRDRGAARVAP